MHRQALGDDLGDRQAGRQAAERVLEDDLHVGAQPAQIQVVQFRQVLAAEPDAALRLHQPQ